MKIERFKIMLLMILILILFMKESQPKGIIQFRITSFERTAQEQAELLIRDRREGKNIQLLYKNQELITEIVNNIDKNEKNILESTTLIIQEAIDRGSFISKHLCGKALDISKRRSSIEFIKFMEKLENVSVIDEGDHYHLQIESKC